MAQQLEQSVTAPAPNPVLSFSPVVLFVPGRPVDLQLKVSMPAIGSQLPILLLSHGHGNSNYLSSLRGYGPLVDFYAANGFVVIQPTHLDSKTLNLNPNGPEGALFWKSRAEDMRFILDHLDQIEAAVPGLRGRLDKNRIAAIGHSLGGHTVGMLTGMTVTDPQDGKRVNLTDSRIKAGVMMVPPGNGADLAPFAAEHFPVLRSTDFSQMTTPVLVIAGSKDVNPRFSERQDWRADAYYLSPASKCLLMLIDAQHGLGGVSGYDVAETTDENPDRVALVQRLTWAYLRSALYVQDTSWEEAKKALAQESTPMGQITCK